MAKKEPGLILKLRRQGEEQNAMRGFSICLSVLFKVGLCGWMMAEGAGQSLELNLQMNQRTPGISIKGVNGPIRVEYSPALGPIANWSLLTTVQGGSNPFLFTDTTAGNAPKRFYRASSAASSLSNPLKHLVWIDP